MTADESGNVKSGADAGSVDDQAAGNDESASASEGEKEERSSRMNAAKAFYRAMYAGEDVIPDDFGIGAAGGGSGGPRDDGPCQNCARMEVQLSEAVQKAQEMENLYKRMAADFENYRKRIDREREETLGVGTQKAVEGILPALDDLERARQTLNSSIDPKAILESMNLVYARFNRCLEGLGVKPLEVIGQPFDPRMHEPVQEIQTNQFPDGAVMHELRKGYEFRDKILRPTLVNVAANPSGVVEAPPAPAAPTEAPAPTIEAPTASPGTTGEPADISPEAKKDETAASPPEAVDKSEGPPPRKSKETADLPEFLESLQRQDSENSSSENSVPTAQSATAALLAKAKAKSSSSEPPKAKDEDEKDKQQQPVGAGKKKGANTGSGGKGFSPTETADLPVFEFSDTLTEMELDEADKSKEQKVYDISDADAENG